MRSRRMLLLIPALVLTASMTACGSDEEANDPAAASTVPQAQGQCSYPEDGAAAKKVELPPAEPLSADAMTIATNRGDIKVALDPDNAPCTVNSFVSLAKQGYFENTKCHRLVPGFVLQCGDPTATGTGGPGYRFADELTGDETYAPGTLAMANAGPNTNGSQFFIVLADTGLPPQYTVFGTVDAAGMKVAKDIEKDGNKPDSPAPAKDVVITSVS